MCSISNDKDNVTGFEEVINTDQHEISCSIKLPRIIDNKLFSFIRTGKTVNGVTSFIARCLICAGGKDISGDTKSSGNFVKHLRGRHPTEFKSYEKRKLEPEASQPPIRKFCPVTGFTSGMQERADRRTLCYIINSILPLSTVENKHFRDLVLGAYKDAGVTSKLKIMSRPTLQIRINALYKDLVNDISSRLQNADYLCLTADCWSHYSRAFLGVTCHWIGPKPEYNRESVVLACTRFKGTHSYDKIASQLLSVTARYGIPKEKVVAVVTDNGSNFCKAFKEYGIIFPKAVVVETETKDASKFKEASESEESDDDDNEVSENVGNIFKASRPDKKKIELPPHIRCASHTLSLVATKDGLEVTDKRLYHSAIGKCTKLWNLSWSPKSAEKISEICGALLKRPCPTRWNSLYDSLGHLLKVKDNLDRICEELCLAKFSPREIEFLDEFVNITRPVAMALDKLQGENGIFLGSLMPTLSQVKSFLIELDEVAEHCKNFISAYLNGIDARFSSTLKIDPKDPSDFLLASMSHPAFKLRWVNPEFHDDLKKSFVKRAAFFTNDSKSTDSVKEDDEEMDPFYDFNIPTPPSKSTNADLINNVELECLRYFNDNSKKLCMLKDYPTVEKMFRRFNTPLPSSAPVERVFSYAGLTMSSRRTKLSDENFEKLVLLKCNNVFSDV